jgi:hypothetical protein
MKAEHRKELQTNTLADMLGRTVRKVRTSSGLPWVKILIVAVVVGGVGTFWWLQRNKARANSEAWVEVDAGTISSLRKLLDPDFKDTNQGKAAHFEAASYLLWDQGIKALASSPNGAVRSIAQAQGIYDEMAKQCKGDAIYEPEAMYGQAVCQEALVVAAAELKSTTEQQLDAALKAYQELAKHPDYAKTAYGLQAQKRAAQLSDPVQRAEILTFYKEFPTRAGFLEMPTTKSTVKGQ